MKNSEEILYKHNITAYQILGVQENASQDNIKQAFKKLALITHSDKISVEEITDIPENLTKLVTIEETEPFIFIKQARDTLLNPETRKEHDEAIQSQKAEQRRQIQAENKPEYTQEEIRQRKINAENTREFARNKKNNLKPDYLNDADGDAENLGETIYVAIDYRSKHHYNKRLDSVNLDDHKHWTMWRENVAQNLFLVSSSLEALEKEMQGKRGMIFEIDRTMLVDKDNNLNAHLTGEALLESIQKTPGIAVKGQVSRYDGSIYDNPGYKNPSFFTILEGDELDNFKKKLSDLREHMKEKKSMPLFGRGSIHKASTDLLGDLKNFLSNKDTITEYEITKELNELIKEYPRANEKNYIQNQLQKEGLLPKSEKTQNPDARNASTARMNR